MGSRILKIATGWFLEGQKDLGLLLLRLGIGGLFVFYHGYWKFMGGPKVWAEFGKILAVLGVDKVMGQVGIPFNPVFWGFMAVFAEFVGGLLLMLGLLARPACLLLLIDMTVAASAHLHDPDQGMSVAAHPIALGIVFLSLFVIGPGRYSIDTALNWWATHPARPLPQDVTVPT